MLVSQTSIKFANLATNLANMTFEDYLSHYRQILDHPEQYEPYRKEAYLHYATINWSRMNRWLKRFEPAPELQRVVDAITEEQHWILITEPWCGDAAHSAAQIYVLVKGNPNIDLDLQLRDSKPFLIDDYLTNGGRSIPKLIIRNDVGHDKAVWGPRPEKLQVVFDQMRAANRPFDEVNEVLQRWYNEDKGKELQRELLTLLG